MKKYKYQEEYENSACFWGKEPAKYVKYLIENLEVDINNKEILDLGAGEGKNSVYLANLGAHVTSLDSSKTALSRFCMQPHFETSKSNIKIIEKDVTKIHFKKGSFDIIIAYGLLHCLDNKDMIFQLITEIKKWTKKDGYFIGSTFTNSIPPPHFQKYLSINSFLNKGELKTFFKDWNILMYEDDIITETHPTSNEEHEHSLSRIIAYKS